MDHTEAISYAGICFTPDCVMEIKGQRPQVAVARKDIKAIRLCFGFRAKHPLLLAAFGLGFRALGLLQVPAIIHWIIHGGILSEAQGLLAAMTLFGGFAFCQSNPARVSVGGRCYQWATRGLEFGSVSNHVELESFLGEVQPRFGYVIEH